jgi:hypothetical protein
MNHHDHRQFGHISGSFNVIGVGICPSSDTGIC